MAKARKTKAEKESEAKIEAAFKKHSPGNPVNVFNISKIFDAGFAAARAGGDIETAMREAFAKYREVTPPKGV